MSPIQQLEEALGRLAEPARAALAPRLLPAVVEAALAGVPSDEALEALGPGLVGDDRDARRRAVGALRALLEASGAAGLALLDGAALDRAPALRDLLPELVGACGARGGGALVEDRLLHALGHASPGRRKSALRGLGLAYAGTARTDLLEPIARAAVHPTDFTLPLEALHALGRLFEGRLGEEAYVVALGLLSPRDEARALDAEWNPYRSLALAARGGTMAARLAGERLLPALAAAGPSRRRARLRRAALEAWVALHAGEGLEPLETAWSALDDPLREARQSALWALPGLLPHGGPEASRAHVAAALLERSRAGGREAACAALCLGAALEGAPLPEVTDRLLAWCGRREALLTPFALLALARIHAGSAPEPVAEALRAAVPEKGPVDRLTALAIGAFYAATGDRWARATLTRLAGRRRPAGTQAAALAAVGMLHRGVGLPEAVGLLGRLPVEPPVLAERYATAGVLLAAYGAGAGRAEAYFGDYRPALRVTAGPCGESR